MKQINYSVTILGSMQVPSAATDKDIKELILANYQENEPNDIEWTEEESKKECKYSVTFIKEEIYEVEAADPIEAENKATDMYNADEYAFDSDSPVREILVTKIS